MSKREGPRPPKPDNQPGNPRSKKGEKFKHPKRLTLDDISRELPNADEINGWFDRIEKMEDREAVIAYGALLDAFLENCLRRSFIIQDQEQFREIFRGQSAPLSSFSSKIIMAHGFGIIGLEMRKQLDIIRQIRNCFAHSVRPLDFGHPVLIREGMALPPKAIIKPFYIIKDFSDDPRMRFNHCCGLICGHFLYFINGIDQAKAKGEWPVPQTFESRFC